MELIRYILLLLLLSGIYKGVAQVKNPAGAMSQREMTRLANMSESELERYQDSLLKKSLQKAKTLAANNGGMVNEEMFPDFKLRLPARNNKALVYAEAVKTDRQYLLAYIGKMRTAMLPTLPAAIQKNITDTIKKTPAGQLEAWAMSCWYSNRPEAALVLAIAAVEKSPDNLLYWNNAGAFFNMAGLHAQAIPVLKSCAKQLPGSSMVLNNLGQAYLGLGEEEKAEDLLEKCLQLDRLNPEANRSMAIMRIVRGRPAEAAKHLAAEMEIAQRPTSHQTIERFGAVKSGVNYADLVRPGSPRSRLAGDFKGYESTGLSKFSVPQFPMTVDQAYLLDNAHRRFRQQVMDEYSYWLQKTQMTKQEKYEATHYTMMYADWARLAGDALTEQELGQLNLVDEQTANFMADWHEQQLKEVEAFKKRPHMSSKEICDGINRINDNFVAKFSGYFEARHMTLQARWRIYVNKMGDIAHLTPTYGGMFYQAVAGYFGYLQSVSGMLEYVKDLDPCRASIYADGLDSLTSNRWLEFLCARGIGGKLPFGAVKVHLDCEGIKFSGSVELLKFGMEKKFKTGTSTIWIGAGVEADFEGAIQVEMTQKLFVVWDKNNVCTDAGLSGTGKFEISNIHKTEFGYSFGVNSGFSSEMKETGILTQNINKVTGYL